MLELYHNHMSVCAQKVRLVLAYKGVDWTSRHLDLRKGEQFSKAFLKLNAKAVVPVLVHNGDVIRESNAIIQYLDEVFPSPRLMPDNAVSRARVRELLTQLDSTLHEQIAVISFCIAFRNQIMAKHDSPQAIERFVSNIRGRHRQMIMRDALDNGMDSGRFVAAILEYERFLGEAERLLSDHTYLVDDELSLADFAYLPYIERLDQLGLKPWFDNRGRLRAWHEHMQGLRAYVIGIGEWLKPSYLELMAAQAEQAWLRVADLIGMQPRVA